jgi:hypothetical protein
MRDMCIVLYATLWASTLQLAPQARRPVWITGPMAHFAVATVVIFCVLLVRRIECHGDCGVVDPTPDEVIAANGADRSLFGKLVS